MCVGHAEEAGKFIKIEIPAVTKAVTDNRCRDGALPPSCIGKNSLDCCI